LAAEKNVSVNRKAYHDYFVVKSLEAGIVLTGTEIKAIRDGRANLQDAYARVDDGEMWLVGAHIGPYAPANRFNHEPRRLRKLLLHRDEIRELQRSVNQQGLTIVPLRLYLKDGLAKVEIALVRGKRQYDKREVIAKRTAEREMQRAVRRRV
jgi:SsrA-binding protein